MLLGRARLHDKMGNHLDALADASSAIELDGKLADAYREKGCDALHRPASPAGNLSARRGQPPQGPASRGGERIEEPAAHRPWHLPVIPLQARAVQPGGV